MGRTRRRGRRVCIHFKNEFFIVNYSDYQVWDDAEHQQHVKVKRERVSRPSRAQDKEGLLLARYKSIQMQDRQGNFYFVRKKMTTVDPNLPTYIKIPHPIPRSWARSILPFQIPSGDHCNYVETKKLLEFDLKSFGNRHQAILMDPPLLLPDENASDHPNKISIKQFVIKISSKLLKNDD